MARNRLTGANATSTKAQQRRVTSEQFQQRTNRTRQEQVDKQFRGAAKKGRN